MSGLREAYCVIPAKPRTGTAGNSPRANARRSIPALKKPPAPVTTPAARSSSASSSSSAAAIASVISRSMALRTSGRLKVMSWMRPRRSTMTLLIVRPP